jgi:hypothetical protein
MIDPARVLAFNAVGAIVLILVTANTTGELAAVTLLAIGLMNSIMFLIFSLASEGLARRRRVRDPVRRDRRRRGSAAFDGASCRHDRQPSVRTDHSGAVLRRDRRLRSLFAPQGEMGAGVSDFPLRPRGRGVHCPYRAKIVPVIQANAGKPDSSR